MKKKINNIIKFKTPALTLSIFWGVIVIALSITMFAMAQWDPPSSSPPGGNTSEPVNVSGTFQSKSGPFTVEGAWLESYNETNLSTVGSGVTIGYDPSTIPSPPDNALWVEGQVGLGTTGPVGRLHVVGDTIIQPGSLGFDRDGGAGTLQFVSWDIGAGTKSAPLCTLDTSGTLDCVGGFASGGSGTITDAFTEVRDSSDALQFSATGEDKLQFGAGPGLDPVGYDATNNRVTFGLLSSCAPDQVLKWDDVNSNWICADDVGSTGSGIGLTGAADQTIRYDDVAGDWVASGSLLNTGSLVEVVSGQDTMLRLNRSGTTDNTEFRVGTDGVLVVNADGANTLFLDSGNLGIGRNPDAGVPLHVEGGAVIGTSYTASPGNGLIVEGQVGVGVASPDPSAQIHSSGSIFLNSGTVRLAALTGCNGTSVLETNVDGDIVCGTDEIGTGVPDGTVDGQTLRWDNTGGAWLANTNIYNAGVDVGVGTTSPGAKLGVRAGADNLLRLIRADTTDDVFDFRLGTDGSLVLANGTTAGTTDALKINSNRGVAIGDAYIGNTPPDDGLIVEGRMGIGVANPDIATSLHIAGALRVNALNCSANANGGKLTADIDGNIICGDDTGGGAGGLWTRDDTSFYTYLTNSGDNVGIGTSNPLARLSIPGGDENRISLYDAGSLTNMHGFAVKAATLAFIAPGEPDTGVHYFGFYNRTSGTPYTDSRVAYINTRGEGYFSGNLGVMTTNPDTPLHVASTPDLNETTGGGLLLGGPTGTALRFDNNEIQAYTGGTASGATLHFQNEGTGNLRVGPNYLWVGSNGRAGIGTTSPSAKLHVDGGSNPLRVSGPSNDGNYEWVGFYSGSSRAGIFLWDGAWSGCDAGKFCISGDSHTLQLGSNTGDVMIEPGDDLEIPNGGLCVDSDGACSALAGSVRLARIDSTDSTGSWIEVYENLDVRGHVRSTGSIGATGWVSSGCDLGCGTDFVVMYNGYVRARDSAHQYRLDDTETGQREWSITTYGEEHIAFWSWDGGTSNGYKFISYESGDARTNRNHYAQGFFYVSDISLKKNIEPVSGALDKILRLEGISYDWKETGEPGIGLAAQNVEKVFPELITIDPETGLKNLNYGQLTGPIIEAIKEQQTQIDELESDVEMLKAEIEKLK